MIVSSVSVGTVIQAGISAVIGTIIAFLGGFDLALEYLLIFMLLDVITGMYVALIGKSHNSENGYYKSGVFGKGIFKKVLILVIVSLAYGVDQVIHTECLRDSTIIFFIINEAISIIENSHCAGVPIPEKLCVMLEVYHEQLGHVANEDKVNYKDMVPDVLNTKNRIGRNKGEEPPKDDIRKEQT